MKNEKVILLVEDNPDDAQPEAFDAVRRLITERYGCTWEVRV